MEIALAALTTLGTAATAAAPVVGAAGSMAVPTFLAGAGASGLGAAAGLSAGVTGLASTIGSGLGTAASILSGGASVLSAMRTMAAGEERAGEIEAKAMDDRMAGVQRRTQLKREQVDILGRNDVAAAAAGLDLSYGVAADARTDVVNDAAFELGADRLAEDIRMRGYRRQARAARKSGQLGAFLKLGDAGLSLAERYA